MQSLALRPWAIGVGLALAVAYAASGTAVAQDGMDLSGEWVIDLENSDEPADELDSVTRRRSGGLGGIRAGVSIFGIPVGEASDLGTGSGDRRAEPQEEARRELRGLRRHLTDAVDALDIEQSTDTTRVTYDDLGTFIYRTGEIVDTGDATLNAEWRRGVFIVERIAAEGPQATERFWVDRRDSNRLHWTIDLELTSGKNVRIERVFDRLEQPWQQR